MRILIHGYPFWNADGLLYGYAGPHEVRSLGTGPDADYVYDPLEDTFERALDRVRERWEPDLALFWFPEEHPPPLEVEQSPIPIFALVGDWDVHYSALRANLTRFDGVLCDRAGETVLAQESVAPEYLTPLYAHDPRVFRPLNQKRDIDVAFVGLINPGRHFERAKTLERVARLGDRYRVVLVEGPNGDACARIYSRARIVVNRSVRGELNLRVFESMACGAVPFVDASNREVREWFEPGREVILYDDDNLEGLLDSFLSDAEEWARVAERGPGNAARFSAAARFDAVAAWAASRPRGARTFRELDETEKLLRTALWLRCKRIASANHLNARVLDELTRRAPHDYRAWALLGNHCLNTATPAASDTERWRRAEEAYARASALAPGAAPLWFNVALCHEIQSRYQAARRSWQHALTAESMEGAELLLELAADRFWIRWQESLVAGRPLHDLLCAEAHVRMAHVSAALSDTPDAQRHLEAAQRLDPLNLSGVPLQAELLWATGRRGDAVALLRGALPEFPFNRAYRKRLCTMLLESGDTSAAEGLARETLRIFQTRVPPADVAP